ncbi:MAG TPA: DUF4328 domain-containing protein [Acidimicrobiales bacterium]|nr:DUF4328 domain-containing protein [Acidimicrobiales bacterium]
MVATPPGWFPDPWRTAALRWWDGSQWTPYTDGSPAYLATYQLAAAARSQGQAERTAKWGRTAIKIYGAYLLTAALAFSAFGAVLHSTVNQQVDQGTNSVAPIAAILGFEGLIALLEVVLLIFAVLFLIWQYHAANVSRQLGYPARLSPGMGVGGWFIPVVNLWFPHWALSDLLPPHHPLRRRALGVWWAYVMAQVPLSVAYILSIFSPLAALVPLAVEVLLAWFLVQGGLQCFDAVQSDHAHRLRHAMAPGEAYNPWA